MQGDARPVSTTQSERLVPRSTLTVVRLTARHARELDDLRTLYAEEMGARGLSDVRFSEALLRRPGVITWGARVGDRLVGFAIVFELLEAVYGTICGNLDDLYVLPEWRGRGVARSLISDAVGFGKQAGWSHLRWLVPEGDAPAIKLYESVAVRAPWFSYVIRLDPSNSA